MIPQNELTSSIKHGEDVVAGLKFETISIYGASRNPTAIVVNGASLPMSDWTFTENVKVLTIRLSAHLSESLSVVIS